MEGTARRDGFGPLERAHGDGAADRDGRLEYTGIGIGIEFSTSEVDALAEVLGKMKSRGVDQAAFTAFKKVMRAAALLRAAEQAALDESGGPVLRAHIVTPRRSMIASGLRH